MKQTAADLRRYPRVGPTIIKVSVIEEDAAGEGYLINLSLGGAFVALDPIPSVGDVLRVRFELPWGLGECDEEVRVVWSRPRERYDDAGVGIEFVQMTDNSRVKVSRYLDRFERIAALIG